MFNLLYSSTNKQLLENNLCNQISHSESHKNFSITNESHHVPITKSILIVVSKDEWDTKEGPGKSIKNVCGMAKGTWHGKRYLASQAEVTLNSSM